MDEPTREELLDELKSFVAASVELLDRNWPDPEWRELVDGDRLDMKRGLYHRDGEDCGCIGAQLDAKLDSSRVGLFENFERLLVTEGEDGYAFCWEERHLEFWDNGTIEDLWRAQLDKEPV